jgi:hypothetical protein
LELTRSDDSLSLYGNFKQPIEVVKILFSFQLIFCYKRKSLPWKIPRAPADAQGQRSFLPSFGMAKGWYGVLRTSCSGLAATSHAKSFTTAIEKKRAWPWAKANFSWKRKVFASSHRHPCQRSIHFFSTASATLLSCLVQLGRFIPSYLSHSTHFTTCACTAYGQPYFFAGRMWWLAMPLFVLAFFLAASPRNPSTAARARSVSPFICSSIILCDFIVSKIQVCIYLARHEDSAHWKKIAVALHHFFKAQVLINISVLAIE